MAKCDCQRPNAWPGASGTKDMLCGDSKLLFYFRRNSIRPFAQKEKDYYAGVQSECNNIGLKNKT
ncbi:MAG TPA: hypothetical protein PKN17_01560, partial [Bacillota bacterium]|jgi:hypothetical protein|nr:hypothetical protein [Bacillota bacterium]